MERKELSKSGVETIELRKGMGVAKTYKLYIGGSFPRTESGRFLTTNGPLGAVNYCRASRKDFRNAVVAARKAASSWSARTAYNRGQILYRIAEILEGRKSQIVDELVAGGKTMASARQEVSMASDRIVYYAGWCDKYQQVFSAVNPVAAPYFNFSVYEPTGIVALISPNKDSFLGLVSGLLPIITGGNTCVALASQKEPLTSISLAEILHTSDMPSGVVNILTGFRSELAPYMASHMDVNALVTYGEGEAGEVEQITDATSHNMKRWIRRSDTELDQDPYLILDCQELKTTWHPVGK